MGGGIAQAGALPGYAMTMEDSSADKAATGTSGTYDNRQRLAARH